MIARKIAYLSYPMTGQPDHGIPLARRIVKSLRWRHLDWSFEAPHEFMHGGDTHTVEGWEHADYIRADLAEIERRKCTGIALVNGWTGSKGCMMEFQWFLERDLRIFSVLELATPAYCLVPMDGK